MDPTSQALILLAKTVALAHQLDPPTVCAVCEHESSWNPYAVRYEPAFYQHYIVPIMGGMSATEATLRAASYGLMQILGEVARELGYADKFLTGLCDPHTGLEYGCRKLAKCFASSTNPTDALLKYNGGGDSTYPTSVLNLVPKYR